MAQQHRAQKILGPLLAPLSLLYGAVALGRRTLTRHGLLPSWTPPVPCVAVGNISWGGTGKTPVTDWILQQCHERGLACAVLTRGYGAKPPHVPLLVKPNMHPAQAGDEPLMLARQHPEAAILVDPNRNRAARAFLAQHTADIFVLDDGFQRVSTGRHLNLVLLDKDDVLRCRPSGQPSGPPSGQASGQVSGQALGHSVGSWNRVLPWGTWREPAAALRDAHAFLIKTEAADWPALVEDLPARLKKFPRPVFAFRLRPTALRPCGQADTHGTHPLLSDPGLPPHVPPHVPVVLVSGVGNPEQLRRTAEEFLGRPVFRHLVFPDHANFSALQGELTAALSLAAREAGVPEKQLLTLCTSKDAVKLDYVPHLYALDVGVDFFASLSANFLTAKAQSRTLRPGPPSAPSCLSSEPDFTAWFTQRLNTLLNQAK